MKSPRRQLLLACVAGIVLCDVVAAGGSRAQTSDVWSPYAGNTVHPTENAPSGPAPPASYASILPPTGADVRLGISGPDAETPARTGSTHPLGVAFTPSLGIGELFNDNVDQAATARRPDVATVASPAFVFLGNTRRLQADVDYAGSAQLYARTPGQDEIDNELNGSALATLIPNLAFLNVRAFTSEQATSGGYAPAGPAETTEQNRTKTTSFEVSPYLAHTFGTHGIAELGYRLSYTTQDGTLPSSGPPGSPPVTSDSLDLHERLATNEAFASYTTGSDLGRIFDNALLDMSAYNGTGVLAAAHRDVVVDTTQYAFSRAFAPQIQVGYEDIAYNGRPQTRIEDAIWSVGLVYTPNPAGRILLRYGHHDGFDAFYLDSGYQLTARTKLFAIYSEGLTSGTQEVQQYLSASSAGVGGASLSTTTGAPLLVTNSFFGQQSQLYRQALFSLASVTSYPRDTLSFNILHESEKLVAQDDLGSDAYSQSGTTGSITWTHAFTPRLNGLGFVQYGQRSTTEAASSGGRVFTASASASYALAPGLSATAQYVLTSQGSASNLPGYLQNTLFVGLSKTF